MELDPEKLHARLVKLGEDWADKKAAYQLLEESTKTVLAELMRESNATTLGAAESQARASIRFKEHLKTTAEAGRLANRAKVNYDAAQVYIDLYRSQEATRRAEMTLR